MATVSVQVTFSTLLGILDLRLPLTLKEKLMDLVLSSANTAFSTAISLDRPVASLRYASLT